MEQSHEQVVGLFSRAADSYERVGPRHFSYFAARLVEFVAVEPGSAVLDVATGTGAVLLAAIRRTNGRGRFVGVDVTPAMLTRARADLGNASLAPVELRLMDAERLAFPDASFDSVLCSFGLQALSDKRAALTGFHRVLRPGGRLGIVLPLGWPFECDRRWGWQADVLRDFGCETTPTNADLERAEFLSALQASGFAHIDWMHVDCPLEFRDEEEWWLWSWSHGTRSLFEQVPEERLPALRDALLDRVQNCRGEDGRIRGQLSGLLIRAAKPL